MEEPKTLTVEELAKLTDQEREKYILASNSHLKQELTTYINQITKIEEDHANPWTGPELRKAEWQEEANQLKKDILGWTSSLREVAQNADVARLLSVLPQSINFEASLRTIVEAPRFSKFPKVVVDQVKDLATECLSQVSILNKLIRERIEIQNKLSEEQPIPFRPAESEKVKQATPKPTTKSMAFFLNYLMNSGIEVHTRNLPEIEHLCGKYNYTGQPNPIRNKLYEIDNGKHRTKENISGAIEMLSKLRGADRALRVAKNELYELQIE